MKKILIIGANGFTGRQILNDLSVHAQYKVTGCSLHPDISPNDVGKYRFIETDIRNEADIKCLLRRFSLMWSLIVPPCPCRIIARRIMKRLILPM